MPSLNQACKQLRIGRIKLFDYLEKLGIEPALVGNTKQISEQHIEQIALSIQIDSTPVEIKAEQGQLDLKGKSGQSQSNFGSTSRSIPQMDLRLFEDSLGFEWECNNPYQRSGLHIDDIHRT